MHFAIHYPSTRGWRREGRSIRGAIPTKFVSNRDLKRKNGGYRVGVAEEIEKEDC